MNPDIIVMLICGATGILFGATIGCIIMGAFAARAANRANKDAWRAAHLYYTRKMQES